MQIIYRAYDGVDFDTEAECRHHETNEPLFKMWTDKGTTQNVEDAEVVEIFCWDGYENFKELCASATHTIDGPGVYVWNSNEWVDMTEVSFSAIAQYLRAVDVD